MLDVVEKVTKEEVTFLVLGYKCRAKGLMDKNVGKKIKLSESYPLRNEENFQTGKGQC